MLIPWQSHHNIWLCTPGLAATSSGDGIDFTLEYILSDVLGFLQLHPFVPGRRFLRPRAGNAYSLRVAPGHA
jgi:hypothetical protein